MAQKHFDARIQWKRDTSSNWTASDPVLLNGEIIIVDTDNGEIRFKIGDGVKKYTQLPFEDEAIRNLINTKADKTIVDGKMEANNPVGTGSFSMNRMPESEIGEFSIALGESTIANTKNSIVAGRYNVEMPTETVEEWQTESKYHNASSTIHLSDGYVFDETTNEFQLTGEITTYPMSQCAYVWGPDERYGMVDTETGVELFKVTSKIVTKMNRRTGKYEIVDALWLNKSIIGTQIAAIGNGTADDARSNAYTLDWQGNAWYSGDVYVGSTSGVNKDEGSKKLATEDKITELALPLPETAAVGQFIKVLEVDESGKVTATEAVDEPDEDDALELVAELGLAEPMTDDEGNILTDENGVLFLL